MDFQTRGPQQQSASPAPSSKTKRGGNRNRWGRVGIVLLGAAVVILLVALIATISFGGPKSEDKYVDSSRLQAVFLNTGQVYFGNIKSLNSNYTVLTNIYYLQAANNNGANNNNANNNITLVKLGCELHEPYDQMVINSEQITFWENLQDNGQVAKAVATFEKQNPNGQKCADQSSSSSNDAGSAAQNAGNSNNNSNSSNNSSN